MRPARVASLALPASCLAAALALAPRAARAQSAEIAAARETLIQQAQEARGRGDHRAALRSAQAAGELRMTPSVRLFIAQEQRELNDPVHAVESATSCLREVDGDPLLRFRDAIRASCLEVEARARAEVAHLVVVVPDPRPVGLRVRLNEDTVPEGDLGLPRDVNPGAVRVTAEARGMQRFEQRVDVASGTTLRVVVRLSQGRTDGANQGDPNAGLVTQQPSNAGPIALLVTGGVFVVAGIGLFGGYAALNGSATSCAQEEDGRWLCDRQQDVDAARTADVLATVGFVSLGVGVATAAVGGLWWALRPSRTAPTATDADESTDLPPQRSSLRLAPTFGPSGVGLHGVF